MIYLTHYRTAATTNTDVILDNPYPQRVHWFPETYNRVGTGAVYPAHTLAAKVLDKAIIDAIKTNPVKTAFILAGGSQGWAGIRSPNDDKPSGQLHYKYKLPIVTLTNIYAGRTANNFGRVDHISVDASACASSLKSLMDVQTLIRMYGFKRVIVLGVEDAVNNTTLEFFGIAKASLLLKEEAEHLPSAFDQVNGGFNVGQGAVLAVFETEDALSTAPTAKLLGAYTASEEYNNPLGQRPDGTGYQNAINGALELANVKPNEIKVIKTHGTGTPTNNDAEGAALKTLFNDFVATSYKQHVGHTLAASGLMETCLLLDDMNAGFIPGIKNRTEKDDVFLSHDASVVDGKILSLAAGMGSIFSAAVFDRGV